MRARVVLKSCPDYELNRLEGILSESLELLGGAEKFFKRGESALVKPNLLTDAKPEDGITTHPNFVQAVVRILKTFGLKLAIADIPGEHKLEIDLKRLYHRTGIENAAKKEGVQLLFESKFIEEDGVVFSSWVREFDHIISLPKFKTHSLMTFTGAVKNIFGLTPRLYRIRLHKQFVQPDDFAKMLLEVYKKCRPTITFVDGILAIEGNGPSHGGTPKDVRLIASSENVFALDSVLISIMGLRTDDIATNREAKLQNLGPTDLNNIEIAGDNFNDFSGENFKLPPKYLVTRLPKPVLKFAYKLAQFRPRVDRQNCNGCRICIDNCPISAIELSNKKASIDYRRCVDCFCCLEVCPIGAMKTKTGPLIHLLELRRQFKKLVSAASNTF